MIGIIIKYSKFYGKPLPENPLALLKHLPKTEIIATISKINSLLQPIAYRTNDDSRNTQIDCLKTIFLPDEKNAPKEYLLKFNQYSRYLLNQPENISFFTRVSCLYGINEVLQANEFGKEAKTKYTFDERIGILDYLLICNERILEFSENITLEEIREEKIDFFEFNAFNQISHNQYYLNVNPLAKLYKSRFFLNILLNEEETSVHLKNYFQDKYGAKDISEFFKTFFWSYINMKEDELKVYYLKIPIEEKGGLKIIRGFSPTSEANIIDHKKIETLDFLTVKKSPIYEWDLLNSEDYVGFLILDPKFLLDKIDALFINDFWFDFLKKHSPMSRQDWGNFIGTKFFEPFVGEIFQKSFEGKKEYTLKMFHELKLKYSGKKEIEVADVYVRYKQQVLVAEVKSNFINMKDGYKSISSIKDFKALDLEKFYEKFGLLQLLEKTLKEFHNYKSYLNDEGLNLNRKVHLFPVIIVNEPILSSGLFHFPLRKKFERMMNEREIKMKAKEHLIWPLLIINVEELQELEQSLYDDSVNIFKLLQNFHNRTRETMIRRKNNYYELLSLNDIIDDKVPFDKLFPDRLKKYHWILKN